MIYDTVKTIEQKISRRGSNRDRFRANDSLAAANIFVYQKRLMCYFKKDGNGLTLLANPHLEHSFNNLFGNFPPSFFKRTGFP